MTHGQGHKANAVFAPRGAWQSGVSADFFALGYDAGGSLLPGRNYSSSTYNYGFNGMRKDDEIHGATGTSYDFGARLYDSRVVRWMTIDPEHKNTPYKSGYIGFNCNPIINIDPSGRTDFYFNGQWIGNDGINNGLIALIRSKDLAKQITQNTKEGLSFSIGDVKNGTSSEQFFVVHIDIIKASYAVLLNAENEPDPLVEHKAVMKETTEGYEKTFEGKEGKLLGGQNAYGVSGGELPEGDVSIHSHPVKEVKLNGQWLVHRSDDPSPSDKYLFGGYDMNVIVGLHGKPMLVTKQIDLEGNTQEFFQPRSPALEFYDRKTNVIGTIYKSMAETIISRDRGSLGKKYDAAKQ